VVGFFEVVKKYPFFQNEKGVGFPWAYKEKMTRMIARRDFRDQELTVGQCVLQFHQLENASGVFFVSLKIDDVT